ncbi:MAG: hypothetical protein ABI629_11235 [bacterium]
MPKRGSGAGRRLSGLLVCLLTVGAVSGAAAAGLGAALADVACVGDCDGNAEVAVNELVVGVGIALGSRTVDDCLAADPNFDRDIAVSELVAAVNSLLNGCGGASATATPTIDIAIPSQTGSPAATATAELFPPSYTPTPGGSDTPTAGPNNPTPADDRLPRVVGAASASNNTIIIQFSRPMSDSIKDPVSYVITTETVHPEVGHLIVTAADFFHGDPSVVRLLTWSQSEVTYRVRVVNVKDSSGNPLAPIQVVAGAVIDPTSTTFPGTPPSCGPHACSNGSEGVGGMGLCSTDADCPCLPDAPFSCTDVGACADRCEIRDSDGDGVPDNVEQLGWIVTVHNTNGTTTQREVTGEPTLADTDGDGLDDKLELQIGSDPRRRDTDGDGLDDYEEYNVVYSDTNSQDSDDDGIDDKLEVEFFKTNALLADSDGDGFDDGQELFEMNRDPRIADLPAPDFTVGDVRLQIYEQYTYTDENGQTRTEDSSTQTSMETDSNRTTASLDDTLWQIGGTIGIQPAACGGCKGIDGTLIAPIVTATGFYQKETQSTAQSDVASQQAFQTSLDKALEISSDSTVTRQVTGARIDVAITLENKSDIAFTLSNLEITALTTDPQDTSKFVPVATLLPESQQQSGNAAAFSVGPGQSRGPIVFSNSNVFPSLVEELMKSPHGLLFKVVNYDLTTADGRNFAFGLQTVRERTVNVTVDFGDGTIKQANAIAAPVLERPRAERRCAPGGDHPHYACASDADCGSSIPCQGGHVIGGLSTYAGTGKRAGVPIEFVLRDIMQMRKTTPPVILAGPNGVADTTARGDDVNLAQVGTSGLGAYTIVVAPGHNGVLDTVPTGDDFSSQSAAIVAGPDGVADTAADPSDVQVVPPGTAGLASDAIIVIPGAKGLLATRPSGDDVRTGPDGILAGPDGITQSVAQGDDVQLVPVGTTGVPQDTVVIGAGGNGIIDTPRLGDDVADVVTGYEVSRTCNYATPSAIVAGPNLRADTTVATGICTTAFPPHFAGEIGCAANADCGSDPNRPSGAYGVCSSDLQVVPFGDSAPAPFSAVVLPKNAAGSPTLGSYVRSVPPVSSDDAFVGPGIPCTSALDCAVFIPPIGSPPFVLPGGLIAGQCNGPETVVRVENRRNGQFRRYWALFSSQAQQQTDFGQIQVSPGDSINLTFVQDADRDGLIAQEEFLHGTSDFNRDTDGDGLDDFAEVRIGWEVGAVGQALRRVFPDPRNADSDGDGLTDRDEEDLRREQCACDAVGPKTLLGSGNLLRNQSGAEIGARPCTNDAECSDLATGGVCRDTAHCDAADYLNGAGANPPKAPLCARCDSDGSLHRSDPRLRDTDGDRVTDFDEVFGYRTGAGIYSLPLVGGTLLGIVPQVYLPGAGVAHTVACPGNYCVQDDPQRPACAFNQSPATSACRLPCQTDGDCEGSHACIHAVPCDDVQVVPAGTQALLPNTVVVATGPVGAYNGILFTDVAAGDVRDNGGGLHAASGTFIWDNAGQVVALSKAEGDDEQVVEPNEQVFDLTRFECTDGSGFRAGGLAGLPERFAMCGIVKPGPDGILETVPGSPLMGSPDNILQNVLIPEGSGQKIEYTDPLNPDTDGDEIVDGIERLLGASPNDPTDTGVSTDSDRDGLADNVERSGWSVSVVGRLPYMVASNPYVQDTDADGLPDYAEKHMPCHDRLRSECPTDPTNADTDGDGLSDLDELSADQIDRLQSFNGFFAGYAFDGSRSKRYATDGLDSDTDHDTLSDRKELLEPFYLSVQGESRVRAVFTDPLEKDTDHDGLDDNVEEQMSHTDPSDPDTDNDQRLDGAERDRHTDPLVPDILVTVTLNAVKFKGFKNPFGNFKWEFHVQRPGDSYPGYVVDVVPHDSLCPLGPYVSSSCGTGACRFGNLSEIFVNDSVSFALRAGQGFVTNGKVQDYAGCNGSSQILDCDMAFLESYTYETLSMTGFTAKTEMLTGSNSCAADVLFQITVN